MNIFNSIQNYTIFSVSGSNFSAMFFLVLFLEMHFQTYNVAETLEFFQYKMLSYKLGG